MRLLYILVFMALKVMANADDSVLDRYFQAVTTKSAENILACFADDAVLEFENKSYVGKKQIQSFYENGLLRCNSFFPIPKERYYGQNGIAVEIGLNCDGKVNEVGDFFKFLNGKISRLHVYSGKKAKVAGFNFWM